MGYVESDVSHPVKPISKMNMRRIFIPEPFSPQASAAFLPQPPVYQVAHCETTSGQRKHRHKQRVVTEYTHTSILTAIRNCVCRIQQPRHNGKHRQSRRQKTLHENCHALICSLKGDIDKISKHEEEVANNPEDVKCGDAFLTLPAMMCKLNKLEECFIKSTECEKQLARKEEMLITVKCLRKGLSEQLRTDERMLLERKKKLCCLIRSLQIFERQVKCSTKAIASRCQFYLENNIVDPKPCTCPDKSKCCGKCNENPAHCNTVCRPPPTTSPCTEKSTSITAEHSESCDDEVTGFNFVYTKNNVEKDSDNRERTYLASRVCYDSTKNDDCQISVMKNGNECDICNDPVLREKINSASKVWMESARQLVEAVANGNACG